MILYAKSGDDAPTVAEHCRDVREAADAVWAAVGKDVMDLVPGLPAALPKLYAAAALLHDVLKANSSYLDMISGPKAALRQPVRHEVLAAVMLTRHAPLCDWFNRLLPDALDRWAVIWAVAGHHFKMIDPVQSPTFPLYRDAGAVPRVVLHLSHQDVGATLAAVGEVFGSGGPQALKDEAYVTHEDELRDLVDEYLSDAVDAWDTLRNVPRNKAIIAVLKALLAAADAAGSAVTERNERPATWVRKYLDARLTPNDLMPVIQRDLKGSIEEKARPFQKKVAGSNDKVTVVAAGCGNGKTTAAYMWALKWADGKKLFFTYPTTGTATAGYINYLSLQKGLPKDLIHGRSEVDLAAIRANPPDNAKVATADEKRDEQREAEARIDSLRAWTANVVNCTVDTVLGLMQSQRRGVYSFPAFGAGAFVFDEIHAYDAKLWGGLLRFLKEFPGVPALLMSASIPPHRRQQLKDVLGERMGEIIEGDATLEGHKRYQLEATTELECWDKVIPALEKQQKVLWVCNTVGNAIRVAADARRRTGIEPIVYHSRFRYRDRAGDGKKRKGRQREVVETFEYKRDADGKLVRVRPGPMLVVATQVCEMSLDVSADLMVTPECPLPSLVQRLGRLNRYATGDDPWTCLVYPFQGLPYNEIPEAIDLYGDCIASMAATRKAVKELAGKSCSQADLAARLNEMKDAAVPEDYSALFDDGWVMEPMPVRDGDQSITVIWENDEGDIEAALGKNRKHWSAGRLAPWTIPMNLRKGLRSFDWPKAGPYPIAPADVLDYSEAEGAQWRKA